MFDDLFRIRAVFFLQPVALGAWFPRIAEVQARLGIGEAELAIALIGMPAGLLLTLLLGDRIASWLGVRRLMILSLVAFIVVMPLPVFMPGIVTLFAALALVGSSLALIELSMNVSADQIERTSGKLIMSSCHGFWSSGVLLGSLISWGLASLGFGPSASLVIVSAIVLLPAFWVVLGFSALVSPEPKPTVDGETQKPGFALIMVCVFALGISMTEGAMADWSSVYLTQVFEASPAMAGFGYSLFAAMVAVGRFSGDFLRARFEMVALALGACLVAATGVLLLTVAPHYLVAGAGFVLVGLGVSIGFPFAVTAAAQKPGKSPAANVAQMTQIALLGFLIGPLLIGFVAEVAGMRVGILMLLPALVLSTLLARSLISGKTQTV